MPFTDIILKKSVTVPFFYFIKNVTGNNVTENTVAKNAPPGAYCGL